jgi:hypothetical protein
MSQGREKQQPQTDEDLCNYKDDESLYRYFVDARGDKTDSKTSGADWIASGYHKDSDHLTHHPK